MKLGLAACRPEAEPPAATASPDPVPPAPGELLIEELYTSEAVPAAGTDHDSPTRSSSW